MTPYKQKDFISHRFHKAFYIVVRMIWFDLSENLNNNQKLFIP